MRFSLLHGRSDRGVGRRRRGPVALSKRACPTRWRSPNVSSDTPARELARLAEREEEPHLFDRDLQPGADADVLPFAERDLHFGEPYSRDRAGDESAGGPATIFMGHGVDILRRGVGRMHGYHKIMSLTGVEVCDLAYHCQM